MKELRELGVRTVPVVSRGKNFVFAQVIRDVVEFLELKENSAPELSPKVLAKRYEKILAKAIQLTRQMPDNRLQDELPNRQRSWLVLMHHVFQIPKAFLDMELNDETLTYESMVAPPPRNLTSSADIAEFGERVRSRFKNWWIDSEFKDFSEDVPTYFGLTTRHEMLERTVWHSTQHVRQVSALLEEAGVIPEEPLTGKDIQGLPLTNAIWDEA